MEKVTIKGFVLRPQGFIKDCELNLKNSSFYNGRFFWLYESPEAFKLISGDVDLKDLIPVTIEFG